MFVFDVINFYSLINLGDVPYVASLYAIRQDIVENQENLENIIPELLTVLYQKYTNSEIMRDIDTLYSMGD